MKKFKMFTRTTCPNCEIMKPILKDIGLDYEPINLDTATDEELAICRETGKKTLPILFTMNDNKLDQVYIGHYGNRTQIVDFIERNQFSVTDDF